MNTLLQFSRVILCGGHIYSLYVDAAVTLAQYYNSRGPTGKNVQQLKNKRCTVLVSK